MSEPEQVNGTVTDPFQARFGVPPGTQPPEAEQQQWEQLCRELLRERDQLRLDLTAMKAERNAVLDLYSKKVVESFPATKEEAFAQMVCQPSILEIIEGLEKDVPVELGDHHSSVERK